MGKMFKLLQLHCTTKLARCDTDATASHDEEKGQNQSGPSEQHVMFNAVTSCEVAMHPT